MLHYRDVIAADSVLCAEALLVRFRVADLIDRNPHKSLNILRRELRLAGDFTAQCHELVFDLHLQSVPGQRVAFKVSVQQKAGNVVGHLVGMTEGNVFGSFKHWHSPEVWDS